MRTKNRRYIFFRIPLLFILFLYPACAVAPSSKTSAELDSARELHKEGKRLFQEGKPGEALSQITRSLSICEDADHRICVADNLNLLGIIYLAVNEKERARGILKRALPINQEIKNWFAVAAVLNSLGKIENDMGNDSRALHYFNKSLKVSYELNYAVGLGTTYNNVGKIYYKRKEYAEALQYYNRALNFFVDVGDRDRARVVMKNIGMAETHIAENAPVETTGEDVPGESKGEDARPTVTPIVPVTPHE